MTRKALLVGIDDYGHNAERLNAPVYEVQQWENLLRSRPYQFDQITALRNAEASPERVLHELRHLLEGANVNDQLVFYFAGHGSISEGTSSAEGEQSLIVSGSSLQNASIRESDIRKIFEKCRPPIGTNITFILDCCHSAGYGDLLRHRMPGHGGSTTATAVPLFAPPSRNVIRNIRSMDLFGDFAQSGSVPYERPVIFAATGEYEVAYEITYGGVRRMLFSMRLLSWLAQRRDTFIGIRDHINPLHPDFAQEARLGGNAARWNDKFPGEAAAPQAPADDPQESVAAGESDSAAATLNIRFMGLVCFADARSTDAPYKARVILPYDDGSYVSPADIHLASIDIATEEMIAPPTGPIAGKATRYDRGGMEYKRWRLDGYTVTIQTGDPDQPFQRSTAFETRVPKLTVLAPELRPYDPDPACFEQAPLLDRFAAFVNLPGGYADIGTIQSRSTTFERLHTGEKTFGPVDPPISVKVTVKVVTENPTIVLRPYLDPSREDLVVTLVPGATILIANARNADIKGDTAGHIPRDQFRLFYKLAPAEPRNPPVPSVTGVPIDDCTVTDWP